MSAAFVATSAPGTRTLLSPVSPLSSPPTAPYSLSEKPSFMAAYGLEVSEEEEDEDDDPEVRLEKQSRKGKGIFKKALSPGRREDTSTSSETTPQTQSRRLSFVGGLARTRSPSSSSDTHGASFSPSSLFRKDRSDSISTKSSQQHPSSSSSSSSTDKATSHGLPPVIDYGRGSRGSKGSPLARRGQLPDESDDDEMASAVHSFPPSTSEHAEQTTSTLNGSPLSRRGHLVEESEEDEKSVHSFPPSTSGHAEQVTTPLPASKSAFTSASRSVDTNEQSTVSSLTTASEVGTAEDGSLNKINDSASSTHDVESCPSETGKVGQVDATTIVKPPAVPARPIQQPPSEPVITPRKPPPALPPRRRTLTKKEAAAAAKEAAKEAAAEKKKVRAEEKEEKRAKESKAAREKRERNVLLKSYEELEVERFLTDFGKHVHQVRSTGFIDSSDLGTHQWPSRDDWRHGESGKLNVIGFTFASILSLFAFLSPTRFMDLQSVSTTGYDLQESMPEEQFRIAALRGNSERLYMTALPMYEGLYARLRKIWRWDSKIKTPFYCVTYFVFWYQGMLLPGMFALLIWYVLRLRARPPKAEVLREMLEKQQQRTQALQQARNAKAEDIIRQAQLGPDSDSPVNDGGSSSNGSFLTSSAVHKKASRYSLAADATRRYGKTATVLTSALADVHERIKNFIMWRSVPATWRGVALLSLCMIGSFFSTPWMMARLPGLALGICFFFIAPISEHRPEWLGVEWSNPFDFMLAGVPNDAQYAMQVLRRRAALGEPLTADSDVATYVKEESDDKVQQEVNSIRVREGEAAISTAVNPAATTNTVDWKKWKSRMSKGAEMAVAGSEMLSGQRAMQLPRLNTSENTASSSTSSPGSATLSNKMLMGMSKGINWGLDSLQNTSNRVLVQRSLDPEEERSPSDGVYWAVFLGSCGHVVVTPERIRFRSLFARKMGGIEGQKKDGEESDQVPVLDPTTGECAVSEAQLQEAKVRTLLDVRIENIVALKKIKAISVGVWSGIDGLEVRCRGNKVYQFNNIVKRDEAFNRILALAPQNWSKM